MFVYSVLVLISCSIQGYAEPCATPKSLEGNCTRIENCKSLDALVKQTHLDSETATFIMRSQCGFDHLTPKVCCQVSNVTKEFQLGPRPPNRDLSLPNLASRFASGGLFPEPPECGQQLYDGDRIYEGLITALGEFPWTALLKYKTPYGDGYACGGALISDRYVITAGHCVVGRQAERTGRLIAVTLGEYDVKREKDCDLNWGKQFCAPPAVDIPVQIATVHPEYVPQSVDRHNDIALIRLSKPVIYSDFIRPICLPRKEAARSGSRKSRIILYVAGWGETRHSPSSDVKLKARLPEINTEECAATYRSRGVTLGRGQICAGGVRQDTCRGDSGGPLMHRDVSDPLNPRWYLTGVVSFGVKHCATLGVPAIYTRISSYLDWIRSTIKP